MQKREDLRNSMALRLVRFGVRSRKLSNVGHPMGWAIKNLLSRAPPCFGGHVKPLVPAAFAVVSTHQPALSPRVGLWPVPLMCLYHKEDLCPNNKLMMMQ
jgi:hypothetical protein